MNTENGNKLRLLALAKILQEQTDEENVLSSVELMDILLDDYGISTHRQTLAADIELLASFGMDIETIKSNPNKYHVVSRDFDPTEVKLLMDAVASSKFITASKSKALVEKIASLAGKKQAAKLKRNIEVEGRIRTDNEKTFYIIDAVNTAINEGKKISFQYLRYEGQKEKHISNQGEPYIFSPHRLVWNGDYYYMIGWSDKHGGIAIFRIDRIAAKPEILLEKAHKMPKDFKLSTFLNTTFRMFAGEAKEVELECDLDTLDSVTDRFGDKIPLTFSNRTFHTKVTVAINHLFYGWVFGFGGKVKITAPEEAVKEYKEMVEKAHKALSEKSSPTPAKKKSGNSFFWWLN